MTSFDFLQASIKCNEYCPTEYDTIKYETSLAFTKFTYNLSLNMSGFVAFSIFYPSLDYMVIDQIPKTDIFDFKHWW